MDVRDDEDNVVVMRDGRGIVMKEDDVMVVDERWRRDCCERG